MLRFFPAIMYGSGISSFGVIVYALEVLAPAFIVTPYASVIVLAPVRACALNREPHPASAVKDPPAPTTSFFV